jgi:starch synthase
MNMRIVVASSEVMPFSKTGGLADVAASLPKALAQLGHDVSVITPFYPQEFARRAPRVELEATGCSVEVPIADRRVTGRILRSRIPGSSANVYLVEQPDYYDRPGLYQERDRDYRDNAERFIFFSRAVLETARVLQLQPDILHANDWQTGLVPALLRIEASQLPEFARTASVYTIHNLAFQGQFWHWDMLLTGLDWKYFNWRQMEFFGNLNLMKTGVVFADAITTVSPTYAREIQTPEFGCGLNGVLTSRRDDLTGILNGVDMEIWNPATDPFLPERYRSSTVAQGKPVCKAHLQQRLGLPVRLDVPLYAMISRLTSQKGVDLVCACAEDFSRLDVQAVFLGSGEPEFEQQLRALAVAVPQKISVTIGYDEVLSHQIEAGADVFLMPSRYEPCGLNQMYSLIYGTVPIVRAVGGLADSVVDATEKTLSNGTANGFSFHEYSSAALFRQICRAYGLYHDQQTWRQLMRTGMERDWSWHRSAAEYVNVYQRAQLKRLHAMEAGRTG